MEEPESATKSCSGTVTKRVKGSHRFKVEGFSLLEESVGWGNCISSDVFTVGDCDWAIQLYPNGCLEQYSSDVSIFLVLMSKETEVRASFDLTLLDRSGNGDHFTYNFEHGFSSMKKDSCPSWGSRKFYERCNLKTSKYLKDDCLVVLCNIRLVRTVKETSVSIPPSNLGHCLKEILDTSIASDIVLKIGETTYKAHKLILAGRSQVFHAQFYGPLGNPKIHETVVEDISPNVFQAVLNFIYSDSFPNLDELESSHSCSSTILAQHLLAAADRYGLERLKLFCEDTLCEKLTPDTVASTLVLADQHNCSHLKSLCLKFIGTKENLGVVIKSEDFKNLEKSLLLELIETMAGEH